jgi:hypothetical protein
LKPLDPKDFAAPNWLQKINATVPFEGEMIYEGNVKVSF